MLRKETLSILSYRFHSVSNSLGDEVNLEEYELRSWFLIVTKIKLKMKYVKST